MEEGGMERKRNRQPCFQYFFSENNYNHDSIQL